LIYITGNIFEVYELNNMKMNSEEQLIFWFIIGIIIVVMLFLLFDYWFGLKSKTPEIPELQTFFSGIRLLFNN